MMVSTNRMMALISSMKRTQIQFDDEQLAALRAQAAKEGKSVAALVRRAVDALIAGGRGGADPGRWDRAAAVAGAFASGRDDIAREHDRYLAEGFTSE